MGLHLGVVEVAIDLDHVFANLVVEGSVTAVTFLLRIGIGELVL